MGLPFTVMEKISEEERLVYLFVLGDNENQKFIFRPGKFESPVIFPVGNVKYKQLNVHVWICSLERKSELEIYIWETSSSSRWILSHEISTPH